MFSSEELEFPFFFMVLFLFFGIAIKLFGVELNMDAGDWIQLLGIGVSIMVAAYVLSHQLNKITDQIGLQNDQLITQNKQLKAQNDQLTLQHFSDYTKRYQEIMLKLPEEINDDDFGLLKLQTDYPNDFKQIKRSLRTYFDLCYEEWTLKQKKLIEPASWEIWESGMQTAMSRPIFREFWLEEVNIDTEYGEPFHKFLSDLTETKKAEELIEKRKQKANKKLLNPQPISANIPINSEKKADKILP